MNEPSATPLKRVQVTENNSTHKTKISPFELKVSIVIGSGTLFDSEIENFISEESMNEC